MFYIIFIYIIVYPYFLSDDDISGLGAVVVCKQGRRVVKVLYYDITNLHQIMYNCIVTTKTRDFEVNSRGKE